MVFRNESIIAGSALAGAKPKVVSEMDMFKGPIKVYGIDGKVTEMQVSDVLERDYNRLGEIRYAVYRKKDLLVLVELKDDEGQRCLDALEKLKTGDKSGIGTLKRRIDEFVQPALSAVRSGTVNDKGRESIMSRMQMYTYMSGILVALERSNQVAVWEMDDFQRIYRREVLDRMSTSRDVISPPTHGVFLGHLHSHTGPHGPSVHDIYMAKSTGINEYVLSHNRDKNAILVHKTAPEDPIALLGEIQGSKSLRKVATIDRDPPQITVTPVYFDHDAKKVTFNVSARDQSGVSACILMEKSVHTTNGGGKKEFSESFQATGNEDVGIVVSDMEGNVATYILKKDDIIRQME